MAFPQTPLPTRVDLYVAGVRTDITGDMYHREQMRITRGRRDWGSATEQSKLTGQINNRTGAYSDRNPHSPHFGKLRRNTQLQVSQPAAAPYLWLPGVTGGRITAPDAAALGITGDIDVRIEASFDVWQTPADLFSKWNSNLQRSWLLQVNSEGRLCFTWTTNGTSGTWRQVVSTDPIPAQPGARLALRATLDVNNGAAGHTTTFYTSDSIAGTWVQLGIPVVVAGVTSIFDGTAPLEIGDLLDGEGVPLATGDGTADFEADVPVTARIHKAELRNGIGGTVVANPNLTIQTAGDNAFADTAAAPNTWTVITPAAIEDREYRFTGEVAAWPQRWDVDGNDVWVPIEAAGVLRRLTTGASALNSAMHRSLVKLATTLPAAYWPCEDGDGASVLASALPRQAPMHVTGAPSLGASDVFVCSDALPTVNNSRWSGRVPPYTAPAGASHLRFLLSIPAGGLTNGAVIARITTTGAASRFDVVYTTTFSGTITVNAYDSDDTLIDAANFPEMNGKSMLTGIFLQPGGVSGDFSLIFREVGQLAVSQSFGDLAGASPGIIQRVIIDPASNVGDATIGHVAVVPGSPAWFYGDELDAFTGERSADRFTRLCAEEGIASRFLGSPTATPTMGPQRPVTLVTLLNECAATDGGALFEPRDMLGLGYRARSSLYNQDPRLTLNYAADGEVAPDLEPDDDDQSPGNDVTASNVRGSSARVEQLEGPNSVAPPPDGTGRYEQPLAVNLESDTGLPDHAGWRVHLNTVDEARYPTVRVDLAAAPHLQATLLGVDAGDLMEITNLPDHLPPDPVRLLVLGYTEKIGQYDWDVWLNCSPGSAWTVGVTDDGELGHADTGGSELTAAVTDTATALSVLATDGLPWVMARPALNANPRAALDLSGWTANAATLAMVASPGLVPLTDGAFSIQITPDGVAASGGADSVSSGVGTITVGAQYTVSCWAYTQTAGMSLWAAIDWHDAASVYLSTSTGSATSVPAGVWTFLTATLTAPASASRAQARARHSGTPPASAVWYATQITVRPTLAGESPSDFPLDVRMGGEVVRVEAIEPPVRDAFGRTSASGWGAADLGGTWSNFGGSAADFSVSSGLGRQANPAASVHHSTWLTQTVVPDFDIVCSVGTDKLATGGSHFVYLMGRFQTVDNTYYARVEFTPTAGVILSIRKRISGTDTQLATYTTRLTHAASTMFRLRFQAVGSLLRAKAWLAAGREPFNWQVSATDTALTAAGAIGCRSVLGSTTTSLPVTALFDDFARLNPQTWTVVRSINGVVKAQAASEPVFLDQPAIAAL